MQILSLSYYTLISYGIRAPNKLSPCSTPYVFLGYSTQYHSYICPNRANQKVHMSRHVIFIEDQFPFSQSNPQPSPHNSWLPLPNIIPPLAETASPNSMAPNPQIASPHHSPISLQISPNITLSNHSTSTSHNSTVTPPLNSNNSHTPNQHTSITHQSPSTTQTSNQPTPEPHHPPSNTTSPNPLPMPPPVDYTSTSTSVPSRPVARSMNDIHKPNKKFLLVTKHPIPPSHQPTLSHKQWLPWSGVHAAMASKFNALIQQGTWDLVPKNKASNLIGCKWMFRVKRHSDGSIDRCKARLIAKRLSSSPWTRL